MHSRHIYILLSSLIHIVLRIYLEIQAKIWRKVLQILGSILLISGSVLFVWALIHETYGIGHFSDISRFALYTTLAGTVFHLFGAFRLKSKKG